MRLPQEPEADSSQSSTSSTPRIFAPKVNPGAMPPDKSGRGEPNLWQIDSNRGAPSPSCNPLQADGWAMTLRSSPRRL